MYDAVQQALHNKVSLKFAHKEVMDKMEAEVKTVLESSPYKLMDQSDLNDYLLYAKVMQKEEDGTVWIHVHYPVYLPEDMFQLHEYIPLPMIFQDGLALTPTTTKRMIATPTKARVNHDYYMVSSYLYVQTWRLQKNKLT